MKKLLWLILLTGLAQIGYGQNIVLVEYFVDTDPGFGNATAIGGFSASPEVANLKFSVPVASLTEGVHRLYIRAKDANGKWSFVSEHLFLKETLPTSLVNVDYVEYFIDADPGYGAGTSVPLTASTTVENLTLNVPVATLATGVHRLLIRARDASGKWSQVSQHLFYKQNVPALADLNKIEYFIDTDPGFGAATNVAFTPGQAVNNLTFSVPLDKLTNGAHYLFVRARDANGSWNVISAKKFDFSQSPFPVRLQYFTGHQQERSARLDWATTEESGSDHFDIHRSGNGKDWVTIGTVKAAVESDVLITYTFSDPEPLVGENFYRLKMVDYDQTYSMSRIISLRFNEALQTIFYPNPTSRQITVSSEKEITSYALISAGGQTLDSKSSIVAIREFVIPLDKFPAGAYVLRIVFEDGGVEVRKVVVR
jgi:hypothetical protein